MTGSAFKVSFQVTLGIIVAGLVGFLILIGLWITVDLTTRRPTYTQVIREPIVLPPTPTATPAASLSPSDLSLLVLKNTSLNKNGTTVGLTDRTAYFPIVTGTLTNNTDKILYGVTLKIKFYTNGSNSKQCDKSPDDIQYDQILTKHLKPSDSFAFSTYSETNLDLSGNVGYCTEVYNATGI